mmetsp:Transcript_47567/g.85909  ORF Transcript_47567/g.85909 Transcript_47567/m.85909 type:complete len:374 (-) Transcript_47567:82-1203(-)
MPASSRSSQKDDRFSLKQIDNNIRQFETCWERVKNAGCNEERQMCTKDLQNAHARLQRSQAQLRPQSSQGSSKHASKEKVADALSRIECVMRSYHEFEQGIKDASPPASCTDGEVGNTISNKPLQHDSIQAASGMKASEERSSDEVKVQWNQLVRDEDTEVVPVDELICKICQVHVVGCKPKLSICSHLFCGDCIEKWFDVHPGIQSWAQRAKLSGPGGRVVPCPVCKVQLQEGRDLYPVCAAGEGMSSQLWQIIASLKIACHNHPSVQPGGKCNWIGEYGSYHEHLKAGKCNCNESSSCNGDAERFSKVSAAFAAQDSSQLSLNVADLVEVIQQHPSGWTYGRKAPCLSPVADSTSEGWFPDWVVGPRKCTE